jgi:hypothetical protein
MAEFLTLTEAHEFVHNQYLEYLADEQRRREEDAAQIRREEEDAAWWVIDRWLQTQEGIDKLAKMVAEAQERLTNGTSNPT